MEKLKIEYVDIDSIKPYENNPRYNEKAIDYVAESIKNFGFKVPVVIDENNIIVTGHTRIEAAKKLKIKEIPVIKANDLTKEQIKAFRLADNKVSDYSIWDNKKLLEELENIADDMFTGFELSDLFDDILYEKDSSVLKDNEDGVVYSISIKTQDKEFIEELEGFLETRGFYE